MLIRSAALGQVFNQAAAGSIELRQQGGLELLKVPAMRVPRCVGIGSPRHGDEPRASFNQPSRQQHALAVNVAAIAVAHVGRFVCELECLLCFVGCQQIERLTLEVTHGVKMRLPRIAQTAIECSQQTTTLQHPLCRDTGGQRQIAHVKLRRVGVVQNPERIVGRSHEAREKPRLQRACRTFFRLIRQGDVRQHSGTRRSQLGENRRLARHGRVRLTPHKRRRRANC